MIQHIIYKYIAITLLWMLGVTCCYAQTVVIKGKVIDDQKAPLELAQVRVEGTGCGAVCNLKGEFRFSCESADSMVVVFSMLGYETRKRVLENPVDSVTLSVMLPSLGYELGNVEVTDIRRQTSTMTDVNMNDMRHMGNASGGGVERLITSQAGVSTHSELSSQYNVRGGSFDENSVYINGIEVYRPLLIRSGQQEGLSIINPDMVEKIGFSAGGFEAKYGEKMSSVLDITYKKVKGFEGSVSASLLGASGYMGFGSEKFSMTHALRYKTMKNLLGTMDTKGEYDPRDFDYQTYMSWSPSQRWTFDLVGVISTNDYDFTPSDRTTKFGTSSDVKEFKVYFDGSEQDKFHTYFGAFSITHNFNKMNLLTFNWSGFKTKERETYDINGEYWLNNDGDDESLGIGTYHEHARNRLNASMTSIGITGQNRFTNHWLRYGALMKMEKVDETMREWEMRDSAGYSLPHTTNRLDLIYNMVSTNSEKSKHYELYLQDTYRKEFEEGSLVLNYGARLTHWDWNKETLFSPRATVAFTPAQNDNLTYRFSTGVYHQTPFYKEMRDTITTNNNTVAFLRKDIKSQRSIHFVLGMEYKFRVNQRPFKFTAEAYYKVLSNLIPYNVDNVRVVYYGGNIAKGYAAGLDLKIYGEFVPGTDSWLSVGVMKTEEKINGSKSVPRPTDQRLNCSLFFSDYFPTTDRWKMTLQAHYAGGLPFGPPHSGREKQVFRMPSYRRVDIGISYRLLKNEDKHIYTGVGRAFRNIWLGLDGFNILDISNVNSYYWVTDITNHQFAVPNYLTRRQINARLLFEF
ncbi:MAG: carboxypeptidase-like regulatory domain-containing protein [Bacteroidaceae bacterium]|nr:carboxypeptidase-like regulatory domain-containing protein [Bacteroidaceae bacterium]